MKAPLPTRGAASLIVVLLLFLVLSLAAAYTSRNLIFEQKTSANQARSTAAFEAAEAGIEWTLAQLNGARIDDNCIESNAVGAVNFQQLYLNIAADSTITPQPRAPGNLSPLLWPSCVFNGASWDCACPRAADLAPAAPAGAGVFPAFRVWPAVYEACAVTTSPWDPICFGGQMQAGPRMLSLIVAGCTRLPGAVTDTCLNYLPRGALGDGLAGLGNLLMLRSGLATPPSAAVTARVDVTPADPATAPRLVVANPDLRSNGITVNTGSGIDVGRFVASSVPGTPGELSFAGDDAKLVLTAAPAGSSAIGTELTPGERMFVKTFGMKRQTYLDQPGLRECLPLPCTAAAINTLLADNPNRIIWVNGNLTLNASIGDPDPLAPRPVLLIVNGEVLTLGNNVQIYGFVYMTGGATDLSTINLPDTPTGITGALVAEGRLVTAYAGAPAATSFLTVTYDTAALDLLRTTYGSWVRLAGSWRDYRVTP